ncbi:nucleoside diphosphate-linked moiety X motif 19 [Conger conger]|uniref:nucleoside diphosphate-linked moiety X motif 19 n=1 Tax=Conger conger TaxID=82655 RepID=UPI002A59FAAA|nr:nucleoside diphosphate-linked moiety X motif 19 [Conger conger]
MNTGLKYWKEAATVILAARTGCTNVRHVVDSLKTSEIASTNLAKSDMTHKTFDYDPFDFEVLLLKRSGKSGFMPNAYVFPGGVVEPSDFSSDWLETFKSFRHWPHFGLGFVKQAPETRPVIFATDRLKLGSTIPSAVALRICAIRETFEESGILLVVPKSEEHNVNDQHHRGNNISTSLTRLNELCDKGELARWRSLVTENPLNFIRMCRELDCMPNIWAMHEWGNWLTPIGLKTKRRYDTAFFICCLQEVPHTLQDEKEVIHFKWSSPPEVLRGYPAREHFIALPQIYELGRMCQFPQLRDLHSFSRTRAAEGCEQFLPVRLVSTDCHVFLLPGDDLYPENVELLEERGADLSTEKRFELLQQESSALHRMACFDAYTVTVHMSITPKYKHLPPKYKHLPPTGDPPEPSASGLKSQL